MAAASKPAEEKPSTALTRGIACLVHFKDHHDEKMHLTLKITVNPKWFGRHVREALIGPFVDAYNKKKGKDIHDRPIDAFMMRCCAVDGARGRGVVPCRRASRRSTFFSREPVAGASRGTRRSGR